MWKQSELTWADPISYASGLSKDIEYWALLYSGQQLHYTGERSFLALLPEKHIYGKSLNTFKYSLKNNLPEFENAWFGYIGYELGLYKNNLYSLELPSQIAGINASQALWGRHQSLLKPLEHLKYWESCNIQQEIFKVLQPENNFTLIAKPKKF